MANYLSPTFNIRLSTLPAWVPSPGRVAIMPMLSPAVPSGAVAAGGTFGAVDPCPSDTCSYNQPFNNLANSGVIDAFCGGIAAPNWGTKGGVIYHGGGHEDYGGNETYVLDIGRQCFLRLDNPSIVPEFTNGQNDTVNDFNELSDGQPASTHSYDNLAVIPPTLGGGAQGTLLRAISQACGQESEHTGYSHAFNLSNPTARWSRFSGNNYHDNPLPGGACALDTKRGRVWQFCTNHHASYGYLTLSTKLWFRKDFLPRSFGAVHPDGMAVVYHPVRDCVVELVRPKVDGVFSNFRFFRLDCATPDEGHRWVTTGGDTLPNCYCMGIDYCEANGKLYAIFNGDSGAVYEIDVPADPAATWTVTRLPLDGDAGAVAAATNSFAQGNTKYKRFAYCRHVKSFVFLSKGRNQPVIVYRPPGT